jgi:hypothetical protein
MILAHAIRKVQAIQEEVDLNGIHQLLVLMLIYWEVYNKTVGTFA